MENILKDAGIDKGFLIRASVAQEIMLTTEKLGPHEIKVSRQKLESRQWEKLYVCYISDRLTSTQIDIRQTNKQTSQASKQA